MILMYDDSRIRMKATKNNRQIVDARITNRSCRYGWHLVCSGSVALNDGN